MTFTSSPLPVRTPRPAFFARLATFAFATLLAFLLAGCSDETLEATYLGAQYAARENLGRESLDALPHRFEIAGRERVFQLENAPAEASGKKAYALQNALKIGYPYALKVKDGKVTGAAAKPVPATGYAPPVAGKPGLRTIANLLRTALAPAGTVLYVFGGGWNWQDDGAAPQARAIGVSEDWVRFYRSQDADYEYKNPDPAKSYFPYGGFNAYYHAGLDCSGYAGWVLYNTLEAHNGKPGYVTASTNLASSLAARGWGRFHKNGDPKALRPGDIVSIKGHVWIVIGVCDDESVLIAHASPAVSATGKTGGGVQLAAVAPRPDSQALDLVRRLAQRLHPRWLERYPPASKDAKLYLDFRHPKAGVFSWFVQTPSAVLADPEGIGGMSAEEVVRAVFPEAFEDEKRAGSEEPTP